MLYEREHACEDLIKIKTDSAGLRWGLGSTISNKLSGDIDAGQRATPSSSLESKHPTLCSHKPCDLQQVSGFSDLDALLCETGSITLVTMLGGIGDLKGAHVRCTLQSTESRR